MAAAKTPPADPPAEDVSRETENPAVPTEQQSPCEYGCGTLHPMPLDVTGFGCAHGSWLVGEAGWTPVDPAA